MAVMVLLTFNVHIDIACAMMHECIDRTRGILQACPNYGLKLWTLLQRWSSPQSRPWLHLNPEQGQIESKSSRKLLTAN